MDTATRGRTAVEKTLAHIGIKGMRWGVRRSTPSGSSGDTTTVVSTKLGKGVVKTRGGKHLPASDDAVKAAAYRQRAKASTTAALDNKELQALVQRMNLEQQYSKLNAQTNTKSSGRKFIEGILVNEGKTLVKGGKGPIVGGISGLLAAGATTGAHRGTRAAGNKAVSQLLKSGGGKHRKP